MVAQILGYIADQIAKSNKLSLQGVPSQKEVENPERLSPEARGFLENPEEPPAFDESIYDNY
ncbi:hypothetical protein D3C87_1756300 [compost metagenome]